MNKPRDPLRLLDTGSDTTDGVRAVLRAPPRGMPSPADIARLASRLPLGPLPPPSFPLPTSASPLHGLSPIAVPSVLPGVIIGAVLGLAVSAALLWRDPGGAVDVALPASSIAPANSVSGGALSRPRDSVSPIPRAVASTPAPEARASAPIVSSRPSPATSAPRSDAPGSKDVEPPPATPATGAQETEVHLLQRAQSALGADPSAALALTNEHARRFPGGALGEESEFIAVSALLALGRSGEARARADHLLERVPGSAYRGRLESLGLGASSQKNDEASPRKN